MKTKVLISCTATFTYAKSRFSHDAAHIVKKEGTLVWYKNDNQGTVLSNNLETFFNISSQNHYVLFSISSLIKLKRADNKSLSHVTRKPVFGISDLVRHKPGYTAAKDG